MGYISPRITYDLFVWLIVIQLMSCITPPCTQDNAFNFDKRGRPIRAKNKNSDPPAILMKRCPKKNCFTRKIHCHDNAKYRGTNWWKNQNPSQGEGIKLLKDNSL
jgi:hypothetical protein